MTLGRAWDLLENLIDVLAPHCPMLDAIERAGDARRFCPLVSSLVVVARAADPAVAVACIATLPALGAIVFRTPRRVIAEFQGHEVDIRVATPDEYGTVLFTTTGPPAHVAATLKRHGPRLSANEADVYAQAGLTYLPPERRDAPDAIDLARGRPLDPAVSRADIRGDLHMHTTYSDGRDPLHTMVAAAAALGYEYIAITDHSEHAATSRTLNRDRLKRQADEIAELRERVPGMAILHGIEADILSDGTVDCPDAVLASLDIVLASLHERYGHDGTRLTERCLRAIRHPLVSIITHPTNQLVGRRPAYDMDYERLYAEAAATGTILEIDGAPAHLDLDSVRARAAVAADVTVSIDSDCHRASALARQMQFGIGIARRAGIGAAHVANTRPLPGLKALLARKRARAC